MKSLIFILSLLFIINISNAQKFECKSKTSEYKELLKANKIAEAYDLWNEVKKNCQKEDQTIYLDGIKILTYTLPFIVLGPSTLNQYFEYTHLLKRVVSMVNT